MTDNDSGLKIQYGYLVYPFNEQTKKLFFREWSTIRYSISKDEGRTKTSPKNIPRDFRLFLENRGYKLIPIKRTYLRGIGKICENIISVKKLIDNESGNVNSILVRISGTDDNDLKQKMQVIKEFIKSKFDIDFDESNKFMFSKTNRC